MYMEFYGLHDKPFRKTPDPNYFYQSGGHQEALARMQHAVEERDFMVMTGEVGSGKTTLSRFLIDLLDDSYKVILIINPRLTPNQLLRIIAKRLGIEEPRNNKADTIEQINEALYHSFEAEICPVIIIDEAQLIPTKGSFDELRLLFNFQLDDLNLFSLLLIGQPELRRRLQLPAYRAIHQRVGIHYHLSGMDDEEIKKYIEFRLRAAGREDPLFSNEAIKDIYNYSNGIPRIINNIASNALLVGFGREANLISKDIISDVVNDFGLGFEKRGIGETENRRKREVRSEK